MLVGLIVATVLAALVLADRPAGRRSGNRSPAVDLLGLVGVVFVNQVLFTVYVRRVHGGDPSFVARHLPDGWFDLADHATLDGFARWMPRPELLAPTVLRVHALLELPIVVFAYLTVCRWFSADVYRRALALVGPVALGRHLCS